MVRDDLRDRLMIDERPVYGSGFLGEICRRRLRMAYRLSLIEDICFATML